MKFLGISNPTFLGVSVATKAICTDYYGIPHMQNTRTIREYADNIIKFKPNVLIVGGWSRGYGSLINYLGTVKKFPIIQIDHGTLYHGSFFGQNEYDSEISYCVKNKSIDLKAYVHPHTAAYVQKYRKEVVAWMPHFFPAKGLVKPPEKFRIGVLGGTSSWYKNGEGALSVARDYVKNNENVEIVFNSKYDKTPADFKKILEECSVIIHTSHLEAYPNLVQEAWSKGIPCIISKASKGLYDSPLSATEPALKELVVDCNIDPSELYKKILSVHKHRWTYSSKTYAAYDQVAKRSREYTISVVANCAEEYHTKQKNSDFYSEIFKNWE